MILKQVSKDGSKHGDVLAAAVESKPEPAKTPAKTPPAKPAPTKAQAKLDPFAVGSVQALVQQTPSPAVAAPVAQPQPQPPAPKPEPKVEAAVSATPPKPAPQPQALTPKPDPKPAPKVEGVATRPVEKSASGLRRGVVARASAKDRAWQSGQLLSVVNNSYFLNVTYSSDTEGTGWPFVQDSDGDTRACEYRQPHQQPVYLRQLRHCIVVLRVSGAKDAAEYIATVCLPGPKR